MQHLVSTLPHINVCGNTHTLISQHSGWGLQQDSTSCTYRKPALRPQVVIWSLLSNQPCMHSQKPQAGLWLPGVCALGTQEPQPSVEVWNILWYHDDHKEQPNCNPVTLPSEAGCMQRNCSCTFTTYPYHPTCSALLISYILHIFFYISADSLLSHHVTEAILATYPKQILKMQICASKTFSQQTMHSLTHTCSTVICFKCM